MLGVYYEYFERLLAGLGFLAYFLHPLPLGIDLAIGYHVVAHCILPIILWIYGAICQARRRGLQYDGPSEKLRVVAHPCTGQEPAPPSPRTGAPHPVRAA